MPVLISYCPLCNSGVVYDRRVDGAVLTFGNTGRLRHFDMVMYDHETESWWQQFSGKALMGARTGQRLIPLPARLESVARFRERLPNGRILVPNDAAARPYGQTSYVGMDDTARLPRTIFPYALTDAVHPLDRVVVVDGEAWTLGAVRAQGRIETQVLLITWEAGQNSIHDTASIAEGSEVGNVIVRCADGGDEIPYDVSFAFAFRAFLPDGPLHHE